VGLHVCKLQRYCQGMLCFEVGDSFDVLVQVKCLWQVPRFPYAVPSPARSPTSFALARCCVWYSMALLKSPCESYAPPRFPYAWPSPARAPTSFAIATFCVWYSTALLKSPCDDSYAHPRYPYA
jgi:hypothetical protein